nr:transposase, MuDR, MULE transposase domain protein [Tanacetum cinerariifolium]
MSFKQDISETLLYKSKPMISKDYKKETDVKVNQIFDNKEALDLAIRLKALDEGYQFLNGRSSPDRHATIALAVHNEFHLAYHDAYTTKEFSSSMSHLQDIHPDTYDKLCQVGPDRWSRAHCPLVRYNYLTSNSMEYVNACIVVYRKLPMLKLAKTYRAMVQDWFTSPSRRSFVGGLVATVDPVELERFSTNQVKRILTYSLGYDENSPTFLYSRKPNCSLDSSLVPLADALQDRNMLLTYAQSHQNRLHVYVSWAEISPLVVADQYKDEGNKKEKHGKPSFSKKLFD